MTEARPPAGQVLFKRRHRLHDDRLDLVAERGYLEKVRLLQPGGKIRAARTGGGVELPR
jgi:hypothetical protein